MLSRTLCGLSVAIAGITIAACDSVSFSYVERQPARRVTVIDRDPADEVHVIHHDPTPEVHVIHEPVEEVHIHHDHVCTSRCAHYYNGVSFLVLSGHRHGPGCGHHFDGKHWIVAGKTRISVPESSRPHKSRRRY